MREVYRRRGMAMMPITAVRNDRAATSPGSSEGSDKIRTSGRCTCVLLPLSLCSGHAQPYEWARLTAEFSPL